MFSFVIVVAGPLAGHQYFRIASAPTTGGAPWAGSKTLSSVKVLITHSTSPLSQDVRYFSITLRIAARSCSVRPDLGSLGCACPTDERSRRPTPTEDRAALLKICALFTASSSCGSSFRRLDEPPRWLDVPRSFRIQPRTATASPPRRARMSVASAYGLILKTLPPCTCWMR